MANLSYLKISPFFYCSNSFQIRRRQVTVLQQKAGFGLIRSKFVISQVDWPLADLYTVLFYHELGVS